MSATITREPEDVHRDVPRTLTSLVLLCNADEPTGASSSHRLDDLDEVVFRRGPRDVERSSRTLALTISDPRMSSAHGRLRRVEAGWLLDDPSSKNGSIVDGTIVRQTLLRDGAVIELGRTFLTLRRRAVPGEHDVLGGDIDATALAVPSAMATFVPELAREFAVLLQLAATPVSVLLLGETGTGKEVIARALHVASQRAGELVAVNCGALPSTLLEAELFGYRRGAFSGANTERRGLVRSADGGTLFLDEIGELSSTGQVALLRVLQQREVLPLGEDRPVPVDLRVIAATLRDLDSNGPLRADLRARIAGHVMRLLPLRARREDLGLLIGAILSRVDGSLAITPPAMRALLRHDWPMNVRELEQVLTTAAALAKAGSIELEHLPASVREPRAAGTASPTVPTLDEDDARLRDQLVALLNEHAGNVVTVAKVLGKQRAQIYKWVKRFAIDLSHFRVP